MRQRAELLAHGYPEDVETALEINASHLVPLLTGDSFTLRFLDRGEFRTVSGTQLSTVDWRPTGGYGGRGDQRV